MDPVTYSELRKIDGRPVATSPAAGSLADMIGNAGEPPMTNYVSHSTTSTVLVTALELSGAGAVKILQGTPTSNYTHLKITIDGNVVYDGILQPGSGVMGFWGTWIFAGSCKIEQCSSNASYESNLYLSYVAE